MFVHDDNDALSFVGNIMGGMTHWLDVSIGNETSHTSSCFKGGMGHYMAATIYHLYPYEVIHMIDLILLEEPLMSMWEELFYELPFWRVIHFIAMIAWRLELHMGMNVPYIFQIYPYIFLRTSKIWEGRIVIFLN